MNEAATTTTTAADAARACTALAAPRLELLPIKGVHERASALPAGATVTVTCSPRHGIERTLDTAEGLAAAGFRVVPHVAARLIRDRHHLQAVLERMAAAGIDDCFVVGGDAERPAGPFPGGVELLDTLAGASPRPARIGVPAYPEGHHRMDTRTLDAALSAKAANADYVVTQLCFESAPVLEWLRRQRERGLTLPVLAGIPGVMDRRRLLSVAVRIGIGDSTRALGRQRGLVGRLIHSGEYRGDDLVWGLVDGLGDPVQGLAGVHVYTFNEVAATRDWLTTLHDGLCQWHGLSAEAEVAAGTAGVHAEQPG